VDIVKIDVEGHEAEVLAGALELFKSDRIKVAIVELGPIEFYNNATALFETYRTIVSFNYSLKTFNCRSDRGKVS
jgi:hypothetical protein